MPESAAQHPIEPGEALGWIGCRLDDLGGAGSGRVEGLLVDADGGAPAWLLIRLGRLGRRTAVPFEFAAAGAGRVWVALRRDLIRSAPEVDPRHGLDPEAEVALCEHFGIPAGRRRATIGDREGDGPSAVPAPR